MQEDLPAFLALLKPGGRMAVVMGEEMLLVARSQTDPHDFHREALQKVPGACQALAIGRWGRWGKG